MRVFLSSVRRGLQEERDSASAILRAVGHEVVRFEDFGATPAASRNACLDALAASEVYVLILGPHYGESMPDTHLAPTEEEFNAARAAGKPILVFKQAGIECDVEQIGFIARVGDYARGRFWHEFRTPVDLGPALLTAIGRVQIAPPEVRWHAVQLIPYQALHGELGRRTGQQPSYVSVLELHVIPADPVALRPSADNDALADSLTGRLRSTGLISAGAPAERLQDPEGVHVRRPSNPARDRSTSSGLTSDPYCGIRVATAGSVVAYQAVPGDTLGSITDQQDLSTRLARLLDAVMPFIPDDGNRLAVVACLSDEGRTILGDPHMLGTRSSATVGFGRPDALPPADRVITKEAFVENPQQVALELAARLSGELAARG